MQAATDPFAEFFGKIDAEISAAETRLAELKIKRRLTEEIKAEFYRDRSDIIAVPLVPAVAHIRKSAPREGYGAQTDQTRALIKRLGRLTFHTRDVTELADTEGLDLNPRQISNALSGMRSRRELSANPELGKGTWEVNLNSPVWGDFAETPDAASEETASALNPPYPLSAGAAAG